MKNALSTIIRNSRVVPFLVLALLLMITQTLFGQIQVPDAIDENVTAGILLDWYNAIYAAVVVLLGFLHNVFPGVKAIPGKWWRVAIFGVLSGVAFIILGWSSALPLIITFFSATGIYDLFKAVGLKSAPATVSRE